MAISQQNQEENPNSFWDELYCEEEKWDLEEFEEHVQNPNGSNLFVPKLLEQDMFWEDEELKCLFEKEKKVGINFNEDLGLISARKEAIKWMLKVNLGNGFSALTSILCVNYFDNCISKIPFIQSCKPWTVQLAAVTCVSLAAKVEETRVPLILDLQVEGERGIFEAKDVQKMELLVLSTLEWKMHPVTPLSFLDHIIRRLGLNNNLHLEFLNKCELILISLLSEWRYVGYLPSVLATATMMHVIHLLQPSNPLPYHSLLLDALHITKEKEKVKDCYELIIEALSGSAETETLKSKRKFEQMMMNNNPTTIIPSSPNGVMDACYFSSDSSNESWAWGATSGSDHTGGQLSVSSSVSSSPVLSTKKGRVHEQLMPLQLQLQLQLPSLSRVFVDLIESPH